MRRPSMLACALLLAAGLATAGCDLGGESERGAVRIVAVDPAPAADPALTPAALLSMEAQRSGLLRYDAGGEIAPAFARSWNVSADGLQYVFRLRRDARWSDGKPVTARDTARALDRLLGAKAKGPLAALTREVERVTAPTPDVVEIALARPAPALLAVLASPALAIADRRRFAAGPFRPDRAAPAAGGETLLHNPDYFAADSVALGRVRIERAVAAAAVERFRQGRADIVTGGALGGLLAAREAGGRSGAWRVEPAIGMVALDFGRAAGVLADERVRLALSLVIDRANLARALFATPEVTAHYALVPAPLQTGAPLPLPDWAAEPIEARQAAAARSAFEAGVAPATPVVLTVDSPDTPEHIAILRALATSWEPLGVSIRARLRPPGEHARFVAAGAFQMALVERIAPVPAAGWFYDQLRCGPAQPWRCSAAADAAIDRLRETNSAADREQAEWLLQARTPIIPLFTAVRWSLVSPRVQGWRDNVQGAHPIAELTVLGERGRR